MSSTTWVQCMPDYDNEPFTDRSPERKNLFEDIGMRLSISALAPVMWAFLVVADLEQVKEYNNSKERWRAARALRLNVGAFPLFYVAEDAVKLWSQYPTLEKSEPNKLVELCQERDKGRCIVTQSNAADVYQICPLPLSSAAASEQKRVDEFWDLLRIFWPKSKVDSWYNKISKADGAGTGMLENLITLTPSLPNLHANTFALRPIRISTDRTKLELEFHSLPCEKHDRIAFLDLMDHPSSSRGLADIVAGGEKDGDVRLNSGDRFTMTTDDEVNKPLPDPDLLELQWHMKRVIAMSGAAGWKKEDSVNAGDGYLDDGDSDGDYKDYHICGFRHYCLCGYGLVRDRYDDEDYDYDGESKEDEDEDEEDESNRDSHANKLANACRHVDQWLDCLPDQLKSPKPPPDDRSVPELDFLLDGPPSDDSL